MCAWSVLWLLLSQAGVCDGNACGAHGICVDLDTVESDFDSGHVKQDTERGEDAYHIVICLFTFLFILFKFNDRKIL